MQIGAHDDIVAAMRAFPREHAMLEKAAGALSNIVINCAAMHLYISFLNFSAAEAKAMLAQPPYRVHELVGDALRAFPAATGLQREACWLLKNLSSLPANGDAIVQAGVHRAVLAVLKGGKDAAVAEQALVVVRHLCNCCASFFVVFLC